MTDQKKEKCREDVQQIVAEIITANFSSSDALIQREMLRDAFIDELLKREEAHEQREEKLVECLKNAMPILEGCQCLGSKGSKERHELTNQITSLLKELGYE